jgi:hypothetical protein
VGPRQPVVPGRDGPWVRPEAPASGASLRLESGEDGVPRIPPEPPRQSRPDKFPVEASTVGQTDLGQKSVVTIAAGRLDRDHLPERERRRKVPRALTVGLPALWRINPAEPDDLRSADPKDADRVAVGDADDAAGERLGRCRAGQLEEQGGEDHRVRSGSGAAGQGPQDRRRVSYSLNAAL